VGINPNTVSVDFGTGISLSYQALMLSALRHWGHDVRLTAGTEDQRESRCWLQRIVANTDLLDTVLRVRRQRAGSGPDGALSNRSRQSSAAQMASRIEKWRERRDSNPRPPA
jgi:hypothetical protein